MMLAALIWVGIYLHHAVSNAFVSFDGRAVPLGDLPGQFVSATIDTGPDVPMTYGFTADGLVGRLDVGAGLVEPQVIPFDGPRVGTSVSASDGSAWWRESFVAVVLPEPGAAGTLLPACLMARRRRR